MRIVKIDEKEFKKIADKSPQITFHQTIEWGNLKKKNGWEPYYIGLEDDNNTIKMVSLLLAKKIPVINKKIFYSPRGLLIDYNDKELLKEFTEEIKKFIKKEKGVLLKIDPYVEYQYHDNNGNIIEGKDNKEIHNNLIELGYKHYGFNKMQESLQPRWMHVIEIDGRSEEEVQKDMESKTRQILRKNEKSGITVHEIDKEELPIFKEIMQHTSDRRDFIDRPLSYYEAMWDNLHDSGILKIMIGEIDFNKFLENTKKELEETEFSLNDRIKKHDNNLLKMNENKYLSTNRQDNETIERLKKQIDKINDYKKQYGDKKTLGGILFLIYGNEVLSLFGGTDDNLIQFQSAYSIHYAGIKYAIDNNYKRYNFYGITGDFNKDNPLYGLFLFKKSFGGHVVELIGEYDLIISKFWYHSYNIAFKIYHDIKKITKKNK